MAFQKIQVKKYCNGGRHYSATPTLDAYKTHAGKKTPDWYMYWTWQKKNQWISKRMLKFLKESVHLLNRGKAFAKAFKKLTASLMKKARWAVVKEAKVVSAAVSKLSKAASYTFPYTKNV